MERDLGHVADIVTSAAKIGNFLAGMSQDAFLRDDLCQSAVLYQFTIVGEACRRVSAAFRDAHPEVDWAGIVGLRNRIVHEYDDINLDHVWTVATAELPGLVSALKMILPAEPDGEE